MEAMTGLNQHVETPSPIATSGVPAAAAGISKSGVTRGETGTRPSWVQDVISESIARRVLSYTQHPACSSLLPPHPIDHTPQCIICRAIELGCTVLETQI
jgi:hypothetical protein